MGYSRKEQLKGLLNIIRPIDGVVMGVGLIIAMVLAGSVELSIPFVVYILVFLGGFFVTGHAMVSNDIIDLEIDKINEPERVLPKGIISVETAKLYSFSLMAIGILLFVIIDLAGFDKIPFLWAFVLFHVILADIYNLFLKGTGFIGNLVVAETAYALFLAGDLFLNGKLTLIPQMVGITGFCANLSREIYKGIIDQKGDAVHDVKTVAVVLGSTRAKYLASFILFLCIVSLGIVFPLVNLIGRIGIILVIVLFLFTLYLAKDAEEREVSRQIKTNILIGPLLIAPFLIIDQILPM